MRKILCVIVILIVYRAIFINLELIGGDWPYYFKEYLDSFSLPTIWNPLWPTGLGGNQAIILPLKLYLHLVVMIFVNTLGIPWAIVQKVFFFWLFLGLAIYSSYKFTKSWIGVLIYTTNTWILLVLSGGQIGIALAYAIAPLVLHKLIELVRSSQFAVRSSLIASLIIAIQMMLDIRVAFLTIMVVLSYIVFHHFLISRINLKLLTINYSLLAISAVFLHTFWILPSVFIALKGGNVASIVDTSAASLEFLSFAKFENSLSLLHPNWPENIFGKVAFMRPEFLVIPTVAFAFLLFRNSKSEIKKGKTILFFAILGLIGAFLAKGTHEPFGEVFSWLYSNIPGFNLFRDPVKFYVLIALSYSLLIPYSIEHLGKLKKIAPFVFIIFWIYLSLPFITGSNSGIFKARTVPTEYASLRNLLVSDNRFSRTLWVPSVQRFGFVSDTHSALSAQDLFGYENSVSQFKRPGTESMLQNMSVKYVIIPYDSEGEIFLNDRKYDEREYLEVIKKLGEVSWLHKMNGFGKMVVYEISNPKPHIWSSEDKLIFAETFDNNWYTRTNGRRIQSKPYGRLNSFNISKSEQDSVIFQYEPQKWATIGYIISGLTMLSVLGAIGIFLRRK